MSPPATVRREPRGRPAIGFQLSVPGELELTDGETVSCRELRSDGRLVGELEVAVFGAALIIDRDGLLAEKASDLLASELAGSGSHAAVAVTLPGGGGFRAEAVRRAPLPYVYTFALAPHDLGADGGVAITIRCLAPSWPAGEQVLSSLRVLTRHGRVATNHDAGDAGDAPVLPFLAPTRD